MTLLSSRRTISPAALSTCSGRSRSASANASGDSGWNDELDDPGAVAQVDEDDAAVVAAAVDPAGHAHVLAHARGVELAGPGVAVRVGAWWSHKRSPDVVHDGFGGDELVLTAVAIAQLDAVVAEDGNVAGAGCARPA